MMCADCGYSKKNSRDGVYCRMFGIMINRKHEGCRYHRERVVGNDTDKHGDGMDDPAENAAG